MVELIFNDGGAAALAMAKKSGDKSSMLTHVIATDNEGNEQTESFPASPYSGPFIDGDISDIASLWLIGDVGDIFELPLWHTRTQLMHTISNIYGMDDDIEEPNWVETEATRNVTLIQRIKNAADNGEPIRIWWSDAATETCGYHWAMHTLQGSNAVVTSVKISPEWVSSTATAVTQGTGQLAPQDFYALLAFEKTVSQDEHKTAAQLWERLIEENAPLRVMENGTLCSALETYYDNVLYSVLPDENFKIAYAIGTALTQGPAGVYDWWYALRIKQFIAEGKLTVVEENEKFYFTTVKKCGL